MAGPTDNSNLELLMTYTTFHIGVYISLAAGVIGADAIKNIGHWSLRFVALPCLACAGLAGGVIASSIAEYGLHSQTQPFSEMELGFWWFTVFHYRGWATMEHTAFWIGVLVPTGAFVIKGARPFQRSR